MSSPLGIRCPKCWGSSKTETFGLNIHRCGECFHWWTTSMDRPPEQVAAKPSGRNPYEPRSILTAFGSGRRVRISR